MRRKSAAQAVADTEETGRALRRTLGAFDLTLMGVGAVVGAGIFSSLGQMAAGGPGHAGAGPALMISLFLTAIGCGFAALCYAEIAAMVPVAGSAYTYAYVALGELVAWIIGWDLIIEYAVGNIYVAQSWGTYFQTFLAGLTGWNLPGWMATDLQTATTDPVLATAAPHLGRWVVAFNLPAAAITLGLTVLLVRGVKESVRFNTVMVVIKLLLISLFVGVGACFVKRENYHPFAPGGPEAVWHAASLAFFSYIGFDAVSTAAEETRDPQRNLPRGMIASLILCTLIYVATAAVMTGLVPSSQLGTGDPLAHALALVGLKGLAVVMSGGAVVAMTAVLLVFQLGQSRIFMAMSRDGLLPALFGKVHPRFRTPAVGTVLTGLLVAIAPSFITPDQALELTNIGTLFAFILVSLGVMVLRHRDPHLPRPFRCPGYPITPLLSILCCLGLLFGLPLMNWLRFAVWLLVGGVIYFAYGRSHSRMAPP